MPQEKLAVWKRDNRKAPKELWPLSHAAAVRCGNREVSEPWWCYGPDDLDL